MIRRLYIQNYAIIDELEIDFKKGLNIITGETGAGKSILLGALSLIQGQRADNSILKTEGKSCIVEAEFDISAYNLKGFFQKYDIDYDDQTIIRRQISNSGKSRAFVNEIPVNLSQLKELSSSLIDIHSQHQNLLLGNSLFQLEVLDALAVPQEKLSDYRKVYENYKALKKELNDLEAKAESAKQEFDYLSYQLNEINAANLKEHELEELEQLQNQLNHAAEIKAALEFSYGTLDADELSILPKLKEIELKLKKIEPFFSTISEFVKRLESARLEIKDISDELDLLNSRVDVDDQELARITQRIDTIYALMSKHRLSEYEELLELKSRLEQQVSEIENIDFSLDEKRKALKQIQDILLAKSEELSKSRKGTVPDVEKYISEQLQTLGIKNAVFKIALTELDDFQPWGKDRVVFFFSANKQVAPQELSKVASGGELSRLMLALKSLLVKSTGLPTIIFDEIDTGVSGEIAHRMGEIILTLSEGMQVINITHLPQIAAQGSTHFLVYKRVTDRQSITEIKLLTPEERIKEIAKMLSGEKVTHAAMQAARELLSSNVSSN